MNLYRHKFQINARRSCSYFWHVSENNEPCSWLMRAYTGRPGNKDCPVSSQLQFRAYYVHELASRRTECKLPARA